MATPTRVRLSDFLLNPEIDEARLELLDGEVVQKPMPNWGHARIASRISALLEPFGYPGTEARAVIESAGASPIPDVAFFRDAEPEDDDYMRNPPQIAVEILSPGQSLPFVRRKAAVYAGFGVESVWIVDVKRRELRIIEGGEERLLVPGDRVTTNAVPGLDLDVALLFARKQ